MQAVFRMRKMEKCKGNTTSHKGLPGHSDIYQTSFYPDTLFPSAQNTLRTAYFLIKCGMLKQGWITGIGSTFEKAVLLLSINRLPEQKWLIYPTCQWKGIMVIKEKKIFYSFPLIFIKYVCMVCQCNHQRYFNWWLFLNLRTIKPVCWF